MDWPLILSTLLSPVIAVGVTLWWQDRKEKRDAKMRLFTSIMGQRKAYVITPELATSLNLIDVIFQGRPKVLAVWHQYYDILCQSSTVNTELRGHKYIELLSAMATDLGYKKLQQTDIDKFYLPQGHADQAEFNYKVQTEWLRVLQNTARFEVQLKQDAPKTLEVDNK